MRKTSAVASRRRRKRLLKQVKGFYGDRRKFRQAKSTHMKALLNNFIHRKQRKRDFRSLWIIRINAAVRRYEISYSKFIAGLAKAGVLVNRKMLAHLAADNSPAFKAIVDMAKQALAS